MSDNADGGTATEPTDTPDQPDTPKPEVDWKAKSREWEKRAKANADAAAKLAEIEEAKKSEQERLTERAEKAETDARDSAVALLRYKVAVSKGLPPELVARLQGDTEEELAADADGLLQLITPSETPPGPRPDLSQGARSGADALNGDPLLEGLKTKLGIT